MADQEPSKQPADLTPEQLTEGLVVLILHPDGFADFWVHDGVPDQELSDYLLELAGKVERGEHRTT